MTARFIKLSAAGKQLPAKAKTWAAVLDTKQQLIWSAKAIARSVTHEKAIEAAKKCRLMKKADWRLPEIEELFLLADRTRRNPAIDTDFFPFIKSDWYWSRTPFAGSAGCAWLVYFGSGDSSWINRNFNDLALAVRSARQ